MRNRPAVFIIAVTLCIAAVLWIDSRILDRPPPPPLSPDIFFYDMGSGKLFPAPHWTVAPINAPSGKDGVRAHVFKKPGGNCNNADDRFIAYLWRHPQPQALMQAVTLTEAVRESKRAEVRRPDDADWVPIESEEGRQIIDEFAPIAWDECVRYVK